MPLNKSASLLLICTLFSTKLYAQIIIDSPASRVVYIGANNEFKISIANKPASSYIATVSTGNISTASGNRYIWTICNTSDTSGTVILRSRQKSADSCVFRFSIRPLPNPTIMANEFALRADLENFPLEDIPFKVVKFTITILRKGKPPLVFPQPGNLYNRETLLALERLQPDDNIIIDNIYIQYGCSLTIRKINTAINHTYAELLESRRVR